MVRGEYKSMEMKIGNKWELLYNEAGEISKLGYGDIQIAMEEGEHAGPSFHVYLNNNIHKKIQMSPLSDGGFEGIDGKIRYRMRFEIKDQQLEIHTSVKNESGRNFIPRRLGFKLGISHYMEKYPQWNDVFFPTLSRCEKSHYWGYMMNPVGGILILSSKEPVKSWNIVYNTIEGYGGHRIYTTELDLLHSFKQPERHPSGYQMLIHGQEMEHHISLSMCKEINEVCPQVNENQGLPFIYTEKYTVAEEEAICLKTICQEAYNIVVHSPDGTLRLYTKEEIESQNGVIEDCSACGVYTIQLESASGYVSEMKVYRRKSWSWYLKQARKEAIAKPQKASTHLEAWYGFFSIFLAAKHFPDTELDQAGESHFKKVLEKMYDLETATPLSEVERTNNTSAAISILVDAYEATQDRFYITFASRLGDFLMKHQAKDGSYRAYCGVGDNIDPESPTSLHYTSVVYLAKSMLELTLAEEKLAHLEPELWGTIYERHYDSVKKAINELEREKDNINTEGEMTFEDGMISCSALQLGNFALVHKGEEQPLYIQAAKELMEKHRCLEQSLIPDCRMRGASLRFWEAQYDILLDKNMFNSPHGWTSWKNYATWYLYCLTGEEAYLIDTMNTLGSCMQVMDVESEKLRWGFVVDPCIEASIWKEDSTMAGRGVRESAIIGEQYMDMISGWWKPQNEEAVGAYLQMPVHTPEGIVPSENVGGCCDNDVHEHFKCLEEIALTKAYVVFKNNKLLTFNCNCVWKDSELQVLPYEDIVTSLHVNTNQPIKVTLVHRGMEITKDINGMEWIEL